MNYLSNVPSLEKLKGIENYNSDYPHSSLGYLTFSEFEKEHLLLTTKF